MTITKRGANNAEHRPTGNVVVCKPTAADASVIVCRGSIVQQGGYLSIITADGIECIVTRRVGMQKVVDICGAKRCKVTGVYLEQEGSYSQYIEGLITIDIDTLQWGAVEPKRLGDPALSD